MNYGVYIILSITLINKTGAQDGDYCAVDCKNGEHTSCQNRRNECPVSCSHPNNGYTSMDNDQRLEMLDIHNKLREKVASGMEPEGDLKDVKVANMEIFSWSYEAEYIAACLAKRCTFAHDDCRNLLNGTYNGQNLGYRASSRNEKDKWKRADAFNEIIQSFYSEVKDCEASIYDNFQSTDKKIGHFTQIIWANTNRVGCAYINYYENDMHSLILVCNYWPGGNTISLPVFKRGEIGPDCGKDSRYPHLCGVQIPLCGNIAFSQLQPFAIISVIYIFNSLFL